MIMLALGVGLYNIIYDYYYIGHGSIQKTQIGMVGEVWMSWSGAIGTVRSDFAGGRFDSPDVDSEHHSAKS